MNGETLPSGHGYPARNIVPGLYDMKNVQWLTEIELVPHDYKGYHQKNGWSDNATVKTMSSITNPQDGDTVFRKNPRRYKDLPSLGHEGYERWKSPQMVDKDGILQC